MVLGTENLKAKFQQNQNKTGKVSLQNKSTTDDTQFVNGPVCIFNVYIFCSVLKLDFKLSTFGF